MRRNPSSTKSLEGQERQGAGYATGIPTEQLSWNPLVLKPQWRHPFLFEDCYQRGYLTKRELQAYAYDFYLRFLPYFRNQPEGSLGPGATIEFTAKMRQKLGLAMMFERKIRLNQKYFASDPRLLPYTLFHEMTHLWLYDCHLDPGHTARFYGKMADFRTTGLPIDPSVHIHSRVVPESKFVYQCPNCQNRWYMRDKLQVRIYCGLCFDRHQVRHFPSPMNVARQVAVASTMKKVSEG